MSAEQRPPKKRSLVSRLFCCLAPEADDRPTSTPTARNPEGTAVGPTSNEIVSAPRQTVQADEGINQIPVEEKDIASIPKGSAHDHLLTQESQEVQVSQTTDAPASAASPFLSGLQPALAHAGDPQANTVLAGGTDPQTTSDEEKTALAQDAPLTPSSAAITATVPLEGQNSDEVQQSETPEVQVTTWLLPPLSGELTGKKCLVLDLDETLVHSSFKVIHQADFVVPVEIDGIYHNVYVIKRPGVDDFMLEVGKHFEIVVFTASLAKYADPVLDILDVHKVVHHRLFRESCHNHMGNYVKDLSQLGRDLKDAIIIDNSPASYVFHPAHAVPISSWFNDVHDTELTDLIPFLLDLTTVEDVSQVLELRL